MAAPLIGRTVRRLRQEQTLTQQALAARLGISASYLNLIEHEQRAVTASLLIKLTEALRVDLAALSGSQERQLEAGLREVFADPVLDQAVPDAEIEGLAAVQPRRGPRRAGPLPRAGAWRGRTRSGIALPSGRRLLLPHEETRDAFHDRSNHFPSMEAAAERIGDDLPPEPAELQPCHRRAPAPGAWRGRARRPRWTARSAATTRRRAA